MTEYELNSFFEARARVSTNDAWTLMSITFKLKQHLTKSWLKLRIGESMEIPR